jgi:AP-2 complex subunit alpha
MQFSSNPVNLIVVWGSAGPVQLRDGAMKLLGKFISVREPNIRDILV